MAEIDYTIEINPITNYTIELNEQGPQGLTGPQGETGATGPTGETGNGIASITYVSSEDLTDIYSINYTNGTSTQFSVVNGADGVSPTASVTQTTTGATLTITDRDGTTTAYLTNGADGQDGTNATITGVSASVTGTTGTPSVSVTMGGTESARTFDFAFSNLKGDTGATGNGIADISKTSSSGLVDTYTITYTNGNSDVFDVTNGEDGTDGVSVTSVTLESTVGLAVNYRMHFSNGDYYDYTVMNGASGSTEWGGISGTLSNQLDLQNALNSKQNTLTPGSNIQINGNTISATDTVYTLPVATSSTLGGIKVGNNLTIGADGTLDALGTSYSQGNGIEISGNTISVSTTIASKTDIGDGKAIFKKNGTAFATVSANQTSTTTIDYTIPTQASDIGALPDTTTIGAGNTTILVNGTSAGTINANQTSNNSISLSIPSAVTESTVSGWGFTKNEGTVTSVNGVSPVNGNVTIPTGGTVDQTFSPSSTNAQSGVAINGALSPFIAITAMGRTGTAWYCEFSNGEIWQGDVTPTGVTSYAVTLPYEMDISGGEYDIELTTLHGASDTGGYNAISVVSAYPSGVLSTGFTISQATADYTCWTVRGKKKVS